MILRGRRIRICLACYGFESTESCTAEPVTVRQQQPYTPTNGGGANPALTEVAFWVCAAIYFMPPSFP